MDFSQKLAFVTVISLATSLTRFLPFIMEKDLRNLKNLNLIERFSMPIILGLLLVYLFRDYGVSTEYLARLVSAIIVGITYIYTSKLFTSICLGTLIFMAVIN